MALSTIVSAWSKKPSSTRHWGQKHHFSSANSINIGRLLPQMTYYIASSLEVQRRTGASPSYIIPAGNLGNAFAAVWARALGFPIGRIILAHNANRTVPDYLQSGDWQPRSSIATLASAMDVGNPSNMERIRTLYPTLDSMREHLSAVSVDDASNPGTHRRGFHALRPRMVSAHCHGGGSV